MHAASGSWEVVTKLREWGQATPWCDWIEPGGFLGRGAGDEWSNVDAGVGVHEDDVPLEQRIGEVLSTVQAFAPVADSLRQTLGAGSSSFTHLIIQYRDGRQLSLAVAPAAFRDGLLPQATAILDRNGRLATPIDSGQYEPSGDQLRE